MHRGAGLLAVAIALVSAFTIVLPSPNVQADPPRSVKRLAGANRYATAAAVSADTFAAGVPVAYVATGENFPDALAGGPAAAVGKGPVLLTQRDSLPPETATELARLRPARIVILGGSSAVSDVVATALGAFSGGNVTRVAGADRYATAAAVSASVFAPGVAVAYVATGSTFPDALAGGAAAGMQGGPVVLTRQGDIPSTTVAELQRLRPRAITVLGGTSSVSSAVEAALGGIAPVGRSAGGDRFATAVAVSKNAFSANRPNVYVATGSNFPDALAGAAAAAASGSPLLLIQPACVPDNVRTEIEHLNAGTMVVLGGAGVLSTAVESLTPCAAASPPAAGNPASFDFLLKKADGSPYRYNPCAAIPYVVNLGAAYPTALADVQEAFRRIGAATGITYVYEGPTSEMPVKNRATYQPARYGNRWAPMLVAWVTPAQTDIPLTGIDGNGSIFVRNGVAVTGQVALNVLSPLTPGFAVNVSWGGTLQHEIGHAMNLAHVVDPDQIMHTPSNERRSANLGAGDVAGLKRVGRDQGCLAVPTPS